MWCSPIEGLVCRDHSERRSVQFCVAWRARIAFFHAIKEPCNKREGRPKHINLNTWFRISLQFNNWSPKVMFSIYLSKIYMLVIPEHALNYSAKSSAWSAVWSAVDRQTVKQTEGLYYNPRPPTHLGLITNGISMVLSVNDHYNNYVIPLNIVSWVYPGTYVVVNWLPFYGCYWLPWWFSLHALHISSLSRFTCREPVEP